MNVNDLAGQIIQADRMDILKELSDNCVDLALTDPPYGRKITKKSNKFGSAVRTSYQAAGEARDDKKPPKEAFDNILRTCTKSIIFGGNYFDLPLSEKWIVWDKQGDIAFKNPFSACELAWTNLRGVIEKYTLVQQGFIKKTKDKRYHPTQKPSELNCSQEGGRRKKQSRFA